MQSLIKELFDNAPLLEKRLGKDAFADLPASPGIYRFYDEEGELLYVGKSKNLRKRVFSYKRAKAGRVSRKISRMISRVARFEIEKTKTEQEALLLENRWIREHRPPFNHANKQTEAYYHIYFMPGIHQFEFRLSMSIHTETSRDHWYGAFKGHALVRRSLGSLLQLLWMAEQNIQSPFHLPVQLTRRLTPVRYTLPVSRSSPLNRWDGAGGVDRFLMGESCEILDFLAILIETGTAPTHFQARYLEDRLHHLKTFFDRKLRPYRSMRGARRLIDRNQLDDLVIKERFTPSDSPPACTL